MTSKSIRERNRLSLVLTELTRVTSRRPDEIIMSSVRTGAPQEFAAVELGRQLADECVMLRAVLLAR